MIESISDWFKIGLKFRSIHINQGVNICRVLSVDEKGNSFSMKITSPKSSCFENGWPLDKTIQGFKDNEYIIIK